MPKVTLIKTPEAMPPENVLAGVRHFLFGLFEGHSEDDKAGWRKIWKRLIDLKPGDAAQIEFVIPRSSPYHRRHFAIESAVFDAQEQFADREQFRIWLKIGAGWADWVQCANIGLVPLPKSISYAAADQAEFEKYHRQVIGFLRGPHAAQFLWGHLGSKANGIIETILAVFDE